MKEIGIIGYGWLGERIASVLSGKHKLSVTTTTEDKLRILHSKGIHAVVASFPDYQLSEPVSRWEEIKDMDVLIITIPVSEKSCCVSSLYNRIQNLSAFIGDFKGQMFLMSSTGVYPDIAKEFTEEDVPFEKVSGERMLRSKYPQLNILRLGGLMGDNRLLKNYNVGNLDHAVNHIHYADISGIISEMMEQKAEAKLYNVTAPIHPAKSQVINAQKDIPDEEEFEVKGKKIISSKLVSELDYVFLHPDPRKFHL
ncbi:NAD-binding protein [Chryseobacterium sp. RRHN12]|uniref:NAD-binding protein n=1 Tax=Chryseobacterium sp. RRHN12 TaxID=3437884 RepID=UPI003D9B4498